MKTILEILELVKIEHLEDVKKSKRFGTDIYGICTVASRLERNGLITIDEKYLFKDYLSDDMEADLGSHLWSTANGNTERLQWLNKHIKLNS